ncbi:MAG: beta-ketoacyl-[acyl-carrier-protein] synthase family protein [Planctomycetes bacterium]|nr:beta-ketoacyl-[acyl-carrier-protein] synthase family protein [Planctomycetota bacterium]MBI3833356.1 beta-ketoacyl-[acyl-carrier-protein] synthase family protein [Planctomycetota bacterium]
MNTNERIVITGVGLTSPNGDTLEAFRANLLAGVSGVSVIETRFMGKVLAGVCRFDEHKYQSKKDRRRGTRAGSIAIHCANEALRRASVDATQIDRSRVGTFLGITEHGTVETENEIHLIRQYGDDVKFWSHHHNPRTVANNPAGEVTVNLGLTGPHYTIGAACAAGNAGIIQGVQMLRLGEVDVALAGGVSEAIHSFGIFASFAAEHALAWHDDPTKACRPFDKARNGIVVSEGGCVFVLERLADARRRGAPILAEIAGHAMNSDGTDPVLPNPERVADCMSMAVQRAGIEPGEVDIVSTHATATETGDIQEATAIRQVFGDFPRAHVNNTKSYIGHAMGAAGALELAGNLGSFDDGLIHPTINLEELDPRCAVRNLVAGVPKRIERVETILNNSFGMLGINSAVVVKRFVP